MELSGGTENQFPAGFPFPPLDLHEFKGEQGRWAMNYNVGLTKSWLSPLVSAGAWSGTPNLAGSSTPQFTQMRNWLAVLVSILHQLKDEFQLGLISLA